MNVESQLPTLLFCILQLLVPFQILVLYLLLPDGARFGQHGCYFTALEGDECFRGDSSHCCYFTVVGAAKAV